MSSQTDIRAISPVQRLVEHLHSPLYRNGYFLILSSLATSGIGFVYWIVATHLYPPDSVGMNSAVISAMTFLAGISELNLMSALIRFIPAAGKLTRRLVAFAYAVPIIISSVVGLVFVKNTFSLAPALNFVGKNPPFAALFIVSTVTWTVFVLQDSVLTGLRQTSWVPIENILFSMIKIGIMIVLAKITPVFGIFVSWSVALFVAILPTNYLIFRKLIPRHILQSGKVQPQIAPTEIIRFAAADYIGALAWIIGTTLMPVIVTTVAGPTQNAYFYLSWTIANALYLIGPGMGASLVVEAAKNQSKLGDYSRRTFMNAIKIVTLSATVVAIGAPYILLIFGRDYSSAATTLLRLLALSAIPNTINAIYISVRRVQRRIREVAVVLVSLCSLVLIISYSLLKKYGIEGVGFGWLVSQMIVCGFVVGAYLRSALITRRTHTDRQKVSMKRMATDLFLIHYLWPLARKLQIYPLFSAAKRNWSRWKTRRSIAGLLPDIVNDIPPEIYRLPQGMSKMDLVTTSEANRTIAFLGPVYDQPPIVVKLPGSMREAESLLRQGENLRLLSRERSLAEWWRLLPVNMYRGEVSGQVYFIERAMPGYTLTSLLQHSAKRSQVINLAADEISNLHLGTAHCISITDKLVERWVEAPLTRVSRHLSGGLFSDGYHQSIAHLNEALRDGLLGRQIAVSWIHGDYCPSNILVDRAGSEITGIVDWDLAAPDEYPLLDLMHLLISVRMETTRHELGQIVADLLVHKDWMPHEIQLIRKAESRLPGDRLDLQVLLLLCWLRHIKGNLDKTSRFEHDNLWASENIMRVLRVYPEPAEDNAKEVSRS